MTKNHAQEYVAQQVKNLSDRRIQPLVDSINTELGKQRGWTEQKAALDKQIADSNAHIVEIQKHIGLAHAEVNELAVKLAEATTVAVEDGRE